MINQDEQKMLFSQDRIKQASTDKELLISPLSLQELIYTLSKLNIKKEIIEEGYSIFKRFSMYYIDPSIIDDAYRLCGVVNSFKNINDAIHLKFAEKYCTKLITYDNDFKKFRDFSGIDIEII
jgi:predicted nucleic acid-binding protein